MAGAQRCQTKRVTSTQSWAEAFSLSSTWTVATSEADFGPWRMTAESSSPSLVAVREYARVGGLSCHTWMPLIRSTAGWVSTWPMARCSCR